ncbi:NADPH-dependent 7-cyano-7-deazaguanine reductase (NADPH-dependent nitrile oxidoreductase) [Desulfonema magnum]|uniref:NADPH-dependent 7-cyano-7-deazaguanine reductase n=2 Tax=Desulfonema magnum TaxID=45655 RepID=A0A975BSA0_9BACT|nr:NADPH-dependent 7-cyano-7-deazaguanine reductase (NADPH-dependent nitrile oxidoreductase) [Desulfonema magnum]
MSEPSKNKLPYNTHKQNNVSKDILEAIPYEYEGRRNIDITIQQPEFTSVCPMTGLPDFGNIIIKYRPAKKIVELKSLKFYLLQYRNIGIFYEHVVNRILDDLVAVLDPRRMEVTGDFTARGGISTRVTAVY